MILQKGGTSTGSDGGGDEETPQPTQCSGGGGDLHQEMKTVGKVDGGFRFRLEENHQTNEVEVVQLLYLMTMVWSI